MNTREVFSKMVLDQETVWITDFFPGMHDVALIEIVVIRCYFNNNFYLNDNDIYLMNKVVRYIFCVVYTSFGNIWILILFVYWL